MTPDVLLVWRGLSERRAAPGQRVIVMSDADMRNPSSVFRDLEFVLEPGQTVGLDVPHGFRDTEPEALKVLVDGIHLARGNVQSRHNTAKLRSRLVVENVIQNISRLHKLKLLVTDVKACSTAFIVGAGPSLEAHDLDLLRRMQGKGAVLATNSSLRYLRSAGVEAVDAVCIESVDASDQLECQRSVLSDLSAHPNNVRDCVFVQQAPAWGWVSRTLNVKPIAYTGNVSAAAVSLAIAWGAKEIVLLGHDLAYTDLRSYAGDDRPVSMTEDRKALVLADRPESDSRYRRSGLPEPGRKHRLEWVSEWGLAGDKVPSTPTLSSFRRWLEQTAASVKGVRFVNATMGGAHVRGWEHITLTEALRTCSGRAGIGIPFRHPSRMLRNRLLEEVANSATAVRQACDVVKSAEDKARVRNACHAAPLVECFAVPALDEAMASGAGMRERSLAIYEALGDAAIEVGVMARACL